ncbi:hybrid sensor histidine kinase/response regulator [Calothrix sp. NIES-3974]|uniref:hybrid sensor histidine kinase/response regulator n=1 Tax=Calothrix sp. NIES-3974 TaxID=2005462 RepID=UPI000B60EF04|nr:response regulator [Calothrix sp. NIES-3974]BAZ04434.1 GAF sensor signal transduction histidine kinase [Calothrix sp. NIES-3974]
MNSEAAGLEVDATETILIVDDYPSNLRVLFTFLEEAGYRVLAVQNGENALQIVESNRPDLILLDILMPGMDGFEVCQRLQAKPSTSSIPIIFLTALSETENKLKGFELGGVDYVTKPIEKQELLARIQTHLSLQKMRQNLKLHNQKLEAEIEVRKQIEKRLWEKTFLLQQAVDFEGLVRRITEKICDSLDENQILQTATEELYRVLQIDSCQIELHDESQQIAKIAFVYRPDTSGLKNSDRNLADFPELQQQLSQQKPIQFVDISLQLLPNQQKYTRLGCPIIENHGINRYLGTLWLLKDQGEVFAEMEIHLAQQVANQCAIAIRQARLYEASQQQVKELEKLNQVKDNFLKSISHELRSPLSTMQLSIQTIEKMLQMEGISYRSPKFTRVVDIFYRNCQRYNRLVDDLLTLCYLDAKVGNRNWEWINLQVWIPEIAQNFLERIQNQQQELVLNIPTELPLLYTDNSILERIVTELLTNACKYTPAGEKITISTQVEQEQILMTISNSGIEIPPPEQERIFDQFYRIPNNDPWQYGGTGLGLALVKKMVELLGATIAVTSGNGETQFTLRLATR